MLVHVHITYCAFSLRKGFKILQGYLALDFATAGGNRKRGEGNSQRLLLRLQYKPKKKEIPIKNSRLTLRATLRN